MNKNLLRLVFFVLVVCDMIFNIVMIIILSKSSFTYADLKQLKHLTEKTIIYGSVDDGKWYLGQEVWDVIKGRGTIVNMTVEGKDKIKVKFEKNLVMELFDMEDYTLDGKYNDRQARRLYPIETKSVIFDLNELFPKKAED